MPDKQLPDSLCVLLTGLIDYAGLFPPAALDMKTAVENYARYRKGEHAWMLGRFVLPAARLGEFEKHVPAGEEQPWRLSVLVGPKLEDDVAALELFAPRCDQRVVVDCIETKVASAEDVKKAHVRLGTATMTYYEVPFTDAAPNVLDAIKTVNGRAKIRTGGLTKEAFPATEAVANFLIECARRELAFKATAGLHHPVRCAKPFTYEKDSPSGVMHGFLNVLFAAALVLKGRMNAIPTSEVSAQIRHILEVANVDTLLNGWASDPAGVFARVLQNTRHSFFISFGSCSFEEPIADLRALNLL